MDKVSLKGDLKGVLYTRISHEGLKQNACCFNLPGPYSSWAVFRILVDRDDFPYTLLAHSQADSKLAKAWSSLSHQTLQ